jgi:hypothetical protein
VQSNATSPSTFASEKKEISKMTAVNLATVEEVSNYMRGAALAAANISDSDALEAVKRLDMPPSQRPTLWKQRWENSAALQREFAQASWYVHFMEAAAVGRVRIFSKNPV